MRMHIQVDRENDQLYVGFRTPREKSVARTVEVTSDVYADLDREGRVIGIDIGNASRVAEDGTLDVLDIDTLMGVSEAAEFLGVRKPNLLRDHAARADFPRPVAELASGRIWLKSQLEQYRARIAERRRGTRANVPTA